ncbi:MAG: hypothetical protein WED33_00820 [Bacteroidia bacterium]
MIIRSIFVFSCLLLAGFSLAQDQIFLKNGDGILDCYIIGITDSVITFRTLDQADKSEYEIPNSETYGFLLEDPLKLQAAEMMFQNELFFSHPSKKRAPVIKTGKTIIYRLKADSIFLPRRGKLVSLTADSMQIETRKRKEVERVAIALNDISSFGYTTFVTELFSLITIPASSIREGSLQFYRKLRLEKGWVWRVMPPGEDVLSQRKYRRKFRKGQLLNLPKSVRKKTLRDLRGK